MNSAEWNPQLPPLQDGKIKKGWKSLIWNIETKGLSATVLLKLYTVETFPFKNGIYNQNSYKTIENTSIEW